MENVDFKIKSIIFEEKKCRSLRLYQMCVCGLAYELYLSSLRVKKRFIS